jgi:ornithine cyclodeaminase/alanine dehydrogenase-like protein (mu-crystallin family)|tara:strand:- start:1807 stop:2712 length:906 start_codon:yes stop_codon:yes gene_type:complete
MTPTIIPFAEGQKRLDWLTLVAALNLGHKGPKAKINDLFLYRGADTLLSRSAWIDGMGLLTKTATIFPGNSKSGQPMVGGGVLLFDDQNGQLTATIDFHLITKWKTAGDSLMAALALAPVGARKILIVGAGTVGKSLLEAFSAGFPDATFTIWNRSPAGAQAFADATGAVVAVDLETAVRTADIILTCTMTTEPIIKGAWLRPGQHLNMIGAYRPDMREADDEALQKSRLFVDSFDTTLSHIGELKIPLETGVISHDHVLADYYNLATFQAGPDDITVFKNGGGAHLDLMTARYVLDRWHS